MGKIGRYAKAKAKAGKGEELATKMLEVAAGLESVRGCEMYVVNQAADDPDTVWITEIWSDEEAMSASLQQDGAQARIAEVLELMEGRPQLTELKPLAGVGYVDANEEVAPYTVVSLPSVEDLAVKHGFSEMGEARFVTEALGARTTGAALQRLNPGKRQMFGHRHDRAEEVYVVIEGGGKAKLDDDVIELSMLDAVRVAPHVTRAFEGGPEGMQLLVFGPRHRGDGEVVNGWWDG
jgi:quinol monooxygenase YgiN/mannose-6-phosphate isomerase-like protein (cupin superfamily)